MERHGFSRRAETEPQYRALVKATQPVAPFHMSMPGSPPRLVHRTSIDDAELASRLRHSRELVKGRFLRGNVGYVLREDLELYGTAFRKLMTRLDERHEIILATLRSTGPLSTRQLREETGVAHKQLLPALHRLQQAFLLYEDQEDDSWERPWCLFESEWGGEVDLELRPRMEAVAEVISRFLHTHVFATTAQIRHWCQLRDAPKAITELESTGAIVSHTFPGALSGWMIAADEELSGELAERETVHMVHKADPIVRPHALELKEKYKDREVLQYLLIDGRIRGAVCGHWRINPHDVEDVLVDLPPKDVTRRQAEILAEIEDGYPPPERRIVRYAGRPLLTKDAPRSTTNPISAP